MTKDRCHITVVSPVYGCAQTLPVLCEDIKQYLEPITPHYEIILVNDASPDDSWGVIQSLAALDHRIKGIELSRNFGQHAAITAGLDNVRGEWIVVMDCDLQDQPKEIPKLYAKAQEGFDVVFGRRHKRLDSTLKVALARFYRKMFDYMTDSNSDPAVANFGIYNYRVISAFTEMREQNRTLQLFIRWLGFRSTSIEIEHARRHEGKSAYRFRKLVWLALNNIIAQSNKPLRLFIVAGFTMAASSLLYAGYLVYRYYTHGIAIEGWTSVIVSLYLIGGLLFANLGILGLYVGKIFDETKARPLYVIRDQINNGTYE